MSDDNLNIDPDVIQQGSEQMTSEDVDRVLEKEERIQSKTGRGPLKRFAADVRLFLALVKDYWHGRYRDVPFPTVAMVVFTLLYVLNIWDLVPDPFLLDDAAVVAMCLYLTREEVLKYADWRDEDE